VASGKRVDVQDAQSQVIFIDLVRMRYSFHDIAKDARSLGISCRISHICHICHISIIAPKIENSNDYKDNFRARQL
jgi:hypothetical protein